MTPYAESLAYPELAVETVSLPDVDEKLDQDEEWCWIETEEGETEKVRFHDYHEIFPVPGLYEHLFYEILECDSPRTIVELLKSEIEGAGGAMEDLRVLDVGAGNGMVGEQLQRSGVDFIVGLDIIEEARDATLRDRPEVYDEYLVQDLTCLSDSVQTRLEAKRFNSLLTVAALGFGDIPPRAFAAAYNLTADGCWIAFNLKEDFLDAGEDTSGFSKMVREASNQGILEVLKKVRYRHRLSVTGDPLHYIAIVARKRKDIPDSLIREVE